MKKIFLPIFLLCAASTVQAEPVLQQNCVQNQAQNYSQLHLTFANSVRYDQLKILQAAEAYDEDLQDFPGGAFDITLPGEITAIEVSYADAETGHAIVAHEVVDCAPEEIEIAEETATETPLEMTIVTPEEIPSAELPPDLIAADENRAPAEFLPSAESDDAIDLDDSAANQPKSKNWAASHAKKSKSDDVYDFSEEIVD